MDIILSCIAIFVVIVIGILLRLRHTRVRRIIVASLNEILYNRTSVKLFLQGKQWPSDGNITFDDVYKQCKKNHLEAYMPINDENKKYINSILYEHLTGKMLIEKE